MAFRAGRPTRRWSRRSLRSRGSAPGSLGSAMKPRYLLLVVSHLVATGLGAFVALWWLEDSIRRVSVTASDMMLWSRYAVYVELQRNEGGPDEQRDALLTYLAALEEFQTSRRKGGAFFGDKLLWTDRVLAHVRLARLEREAGNGVKFTEHIDEARAACVKIPWKNCEPAHLVGVSEAAERKFYGSQEKLSE